MRLTKWRLIPVTLLLLALTALTTAADSGEKRLAVLSEPDLVQALNDLDLERDNWSHSYDWGVREEYPQRLKEYNEQMRTFQLERLELQLQLFTLRGDETSITRVKQGIDKLQNDQQGTPRDLPRERSTDRDASVKGGER